MSSEQKTAQPANPMFSFADVQPVSPSYLWKPYIIRNNLNLVYGDGGTGKSMLIAALFTALTSGKQPDGMPGELQKEPCTAIYFGAEDDPEAFRHRLDLCGCDPSRVFSLPAIDMPGMIATGAIKQRIDEVHARLLVFDPIQAFLPSGADLNAASDIRPIMDGLRAICRETGCTAILVGHTNKSEKSKAVHRSAGSADLVNASRSALLVGYHKDVKGVRVAVQAKSNAEYGEAIQFSIDSNGGFQWLGTCELSEEEVVNAPRTKSPKAPPADPVMLLVKTLVQANPNGWQGTAAQMLGEAGKVPGCALLNDARSIGRRLSSILNELSTAGILATTRSTNKGTLYNFQPSPFKMIEGQQNTDDGKEDGE